MRGEKSARRRGVLLVLIATVLWSMAGLFARLLGHLDLWTVMGWRALMGAGSISVVGLIEWRRGRMDESFGFGPLSPVLALLAMVAISAYTASVMTTTIADVLIIYATLPFAAAALGWLVNRERVSPRTLVASGVALAGIALMVASGLGSGQAPGPVAVDADDPVLRRHDRASATAAGGVDHRRQRHRRAGFRPLRPLQFASSANRPF